MLSDIQRSVQVQCIWTIDHVNAQLSSSTAVESSLRRRYASIAVVLYL